MRRWTMLLGALILMTCMMNGMGTGQTAVAVSPQKKALIVVDPGFSKYSLRIAEQILKEIKTKGYSVELVLTKQLHAGDLEGIDLLVLGGPTYASRPSDGIRKAVELLKTPKGQKTLLFITGAKDCSRSAAALRKMAVARGMEIAGEQQFLANTEDASRVTQKIDELIENVR